MNTKNVARYLWRGRRDVNWYKDCQEVFVEIFGEKDLLLVCRLFAATSINTSLRSNITLFRKAFYEIKHDKPVGRYLPNIALQLERIRRGDPLSGRKIESFAEAMSGNIAAVVVDIWISRVFGVYKQYHRKESDTMRSAGVTDKNYTLIENYIREEAYAAGLEPRQFCSMLWAGIRTEYTGKSETHYKDLLRYQFNNLFGVFL